MKILFLDQSGKLGGAELCLADIAGQYRDRCLVGLFADGPFRELLERQQIPVQVFANQSIQVRKASSLATGISSIGQLIPLIRQVVRLSRDYDLIYANTQKALVVGAIASIFAHKPLVYHLHDIISLEHFSRTNQLVVVTLANYFAKLVIANSEATKSAFIAAGGRSDRVHVVYNGFNLEAFQQSVDPTAIRQELGFEGKFIVGHFSRLSPWKGQHVLIAALTHCAEDVVAILVGDALFGEQDYVCELKEQVQSLGLTSRVKFLGFRADVIPLMASCDLITHTSIASEPFGRVIVEAMLSGKPIIAAAAGGAIELVTDAQTGWLVSPQDPMQLAAAIMKCRDRRDEAVAIAQSAQAQASQRFNLVHTNQQLNQLLLAAILKLPTPDSKS